MQGIGIGESDFKGLRIRNNYYIIAYTMEGE